VGRFKTNGQTLCHEEIDSWKPFDYETRFPWIWGTKNCKNLEIPTVAWELKHDCRDNRREGTVRHGDVYPSRLADMKGSAPVNSIDSQKI
jgi:hypothetical protein